MSFGRIFANAIARRVAFVLVALLFAALGIDGARAAQYPDQGAAYGACSADNVAAAASPNAKDPQAIGNCNVTGSETSYGCRYRDRFNEPRACAFFSRGVSDATYTWPAGKGCSSRGTTTRPRLPVSGSIECNTGCSMTYRATGDGETSIVSPNGRMCKGDKSDCDAIPATQGNFVWNGGMGVCQPVAPECPEGQKAHGMECVKEDACPDGMAYQNGVCVTKEDTCPPGQIKSPAGGCLPGEGQCASGEVRSKAGTCSRDSDGDGIADDDQDKDGDDDKKKTEASGGDSCDTPPSCSGDSIQCMQVKIQWRIDCNTRKKANITGGHCGAGGMPVCVGDGCKASEHQQLIQQWKTACALEKMAGRGSEDGSGDGQPNWTKVTGTGKEGEGEEPDGPVREVDFDAGSRLDASGFSGGGSCPRLGVIQLPFGKTFDLDSKPWACDLFFMTRIFLILLGTFIGLGILLGWKI